MTGFRIQSTSWKAHVFLHFRTFGDLNNSVSIISNVDQKNAFHFVFTLVAIVIVSLLYVITINTL